MLTSDLLVTKTSKGKIEPVYALLDQDNLEIAKSVVDVFEEHVGKTYGELVEELDGIEEINYRLIRGLAQVLERRCTIDADSVIDPAAARRAVFEESKGFITDAGERRQVLDEVAKKLSIELDDLERALWADHEGNQVIKEFQTMAAEDLLRQYNLSLVQTLLFRATSMEIEIEDNFQQVFRKIKQLGLIYSIQNGKISLEGPTSLFKLTEKYGSAFAHRRPVEWLSQEPWVLPEKEGLMSTLREIKRYSNLVEAEKHIIGSSIPDTQVNPGDKTTISIKSKRIQLKGLPGRIQSAIERKGQIIL
jgi:predicted nuclease of restriction endonuclease-like RecB superfamily